MEKISSFRGEYRFLSNFWPAKVQYENIQFPTVEHGYQAAKSLDPNIRKEFSLLERPSQAKKYGQLIAVRPNWEVLKLQVMRDLVMQKFMESPLRERLLETGDVPLIEGNDWGDVFWGVCNEEGQNWLGRILMETRFLLKQLD